MGKIPNWSRKQRKEKDFIKYYWEHDNRAVSVTVTSDVPEYEREVEGFKYEVTVAEHESFNNKRGRTGGSGSAMIDSTLAKSSEDARKWAVKWMKNHPNP